MILFLSGNPEGTMEAIDVQMDSSPRKRVFERLVCINVLERPPQQAPTRGDEITKVSESP